MESRRRGPPCGTPNSVQAAERQFIRRGPAMLEDDRQRFSRRRLPLSMG
jgi:hypothetical protein